FVPEWHRMEYAVGFRCTGHMPPPRSGQPEGMFHRLLRRAFREHVVLYGNLVLPLVHPAADRTVFAFAVFTDDHNIEILRVQKRRADAVENLRRTDIDLKLELPPDLEEQPPQGNMIGHFRCIAHHSEKYTVRLAEPLHSVRSHHAAVLQVVVTSVNKLLIFKLQSAD